VKNLLNDSAVNAIIFGGVFFVISGVLALRLKEPKPLEDEEEMVFSAGGGH
jgi:maltose/moltooligosaccharide transporter